MEINVTEEMFLWNVGNILVHFEILQIIIKRIILGYKLSVEVFLF